MALNAKTTRTTTERTMRRKGKKKHQPYEFYVHLNWINMSSMIAFDVRFIFQFVSLILSFLCNLLFFASQIDWVWMFWGKNPGRFEFYLFIHSIGWHKMCVPYDMYTLCTRVSWRMCARAQPNWNSHYVYA